MLCFYKVFKVKIQDYAWLLLCFSFSVLLFLQSCVSRNQAFRDIDLHVMEQDFSKARALIREEKDYLYPDNDAILFHLDDGMLALYENDRKSSIEQLRKAEALMQEAQTKSLSKEALSYIINDTVLEYQGKDYEQLFTNILLSLNYLENNNFDDGYVEVRRAQNIIQRIQNNHQIIYDSFNSSDDAYIKIEEYQLPLIDSALMRLFSSWLYRADVDRSNYEVALRNYKHAVELQPEIYDFLSSDHELENSFDKNLMHPSIQVVALTGRVPGLLEKRFSINSVKNGILVSSFQEKSFSPNARAANSSVQRDAVVFPLPSFGVPINASFALPEIKAFTPIVYEIELVVDGKPIGWLQKTESLENIAVRFFESNIDFIYFKTISRVIIKAVALGIASVEAERQSGDLGRFIADLGSIAFSQLSEKADLRNARYFPSTIWTGDFSLEGYTTGKEYMISFLYYNKQGDILYEETKPIVIRKGASVLNLLSSSFPQ